MDDDLEQLVANVEALHAGPDDVVVFSAPGHIDDETAKRLRETWQLVCPGRRCIVMGDGLNVQTLGQHRQLERIERNLAAVQATLAAVLAALTKDDEPLEQRTLDGDLFPSGERDQTRPL